MKRVMGKMKRREREAKWRELELIMREVSERTLHRLGGLWADMITDESNRGMESLKGFLLGWTYLCYIEEL